MGLGKDGFDQSDDVPTHVKVEAFKEEQRRQPTPRGTSDWDVANTSPAVPTKISGLKTPGEGVNPKDKIGASKVDFTIIPHSAKVQWALAQMDGVTKYGAYNWRVEPVQVMTYLSAAERHLDAFREGEEVADDSLVHHLGHVMACCAIIIDAMAVGKAIDNRPVLGQGSTHMKIANTLIKEKPAGWGR
jgi:hypothetical protein